MIKVLVAALLGTVVGIVVMVVVIVAAGTETSNSSSIGLSGGVSTASLSTGASTPASTPASSGGSSGGSSTGGGNAAAGKPVFDSNGCGSCHTLSVANATGTIGPNLGTAVAGDAQKDNMPLAAFIKQSITDPAAYTASGGPWATPMPTTFGSSLSSTQIDDLVALIMSGQGK